MNVKKIMILLCVLLMPLTLSSCENNSTEKDYYPLVDISCSSKENSFESVVPLILLKEDRSSFTVTDSSKVKMRLDKNVCTYTKTGLTIKIRFNTVSSFFFD